MRCQASIGIGDIDFRFAGRGKHRCMKRATYTNGERHVCTQHAKAEDGTIRVGMKRIGETA